MDFFVFTKLGNDALLDKGRSSMDILNKGIYIQSTSDILLNQEYIRTCSLIPKLGDVPVKFKKGIAL